MSLCPSPPAKKAKVETPEADNEPTSAKKDKKDKKKKKKTEKNKTDTSAAVEDDLEMAEAPAKEKSPEPAELPVKEKSPDLAEPPAEENSAELVESPAKEKSPEIADSPVKEKKQKREKKKKPKAETETNDTGIDDEQVNQRHKGVFEKKAKSMKAPDPEKVVDRQDEDQDVSMPDAPEPEEVHGLQPLPQPEPRAPEAPTAPQTELPSWIYDHITVPRDEKKPFTDFGLRPDCGITPRSFKKTRGKRV
ncbi:ATP-dependent RNA helicase dbp6 [Apiospora arundinis]